MLRKLLLCALLALTSGTASHAQELALHSSYSVNRASATRLDAGLSGRLEGAVGSVYGGVSGQTLADPSLIGSLDVFVGLRPRIGQYTMDMIVVRPLADPSTAMTVSIGRPLGDSANLAARFAYDDRSTVVETGARASLLVSRTTRLAAGIGMRSDESSDDLDVGFDVGLTRTLAGDSQIAFSYSDAPASLARAAVTLDVRF